MATIKPYNLRVRIDPGTYQKIKELSTDNHTSKSVVIRMLLLKAITELDTQNQQPCERDEED